MTVADGVIVEVVGGGDFDAAAAEFGIDVVVDNDGDASAGQRQGDLFAHQVAIALVAGVNGDSGVSEHGFGAGGGDHHVAAAVGQRVAEMPQMAVFFSGFHFQVGNGGVQYRIPVHQALAAVDQTFFVQTDENFPNGFGQPFVHGETFTAPVQRGAHAAQLAGDVVAGFRFPLPDLFDKRFPAEVVAGLAFGVEASFHHHLGGDAGVVGARLPEGALAFHAVVADQRIHDGVLERVSHVQAARDVGGRDHDAV